MRGQIYKTIFAITFSTREDIETIKPLLKEIIADKISSLWINFIDLVVYDEIRPTKIKYQYKIIIELLVDWKQSYSTLDRLSKMIW